MMNIYKITNTIPQYFLELVIKSYDINNLCSVINFLVAAMKNANRPSRHKILSILLQINNGILWSVCIAQETESLSAAGVAICG